MYRVMFATLVIGWVWGLVSGGLAEEETVIEDRPLTASGYHSPSCSPDGKWISFLGYSPRASGGVGQDLYLMSVDGTTLRRLTSQSIVEAPRWAPLSDRLVFTALRSAIEGGDSGVWALGLSSTAKPQQYLKAPPENAPHAPAYSPDGKYIAYVHCEKEGSDRLAIWTIDLQRMGVRDVIPVPENLAISDRAGLWWMGDSEGIRFLATENKGQRQELGLWELNVKSRRTSGLYVFPEGWQVSSLAYSADRKRLAYIRKQDGVEELVVGDERGANPVVVAQLERRPQLLPKPFESDVSWLGNDAIVYVSGANLQMVRFGKPGEAPILASRNNLTELYGALQRYARLHRGYLPTREHDKDAYREDDPYFWVLALRDFVHSNSVFYSPGDAARDKPSSYELNEKYQGQLLGTIASLNEAILMQEREAFHNGRRVVLYTNGKTAVLDR